MTAADLEKAFLRMGVKSGAIPLAFRDVLISIARSVK